MKTLGSIVKYRKGKPPKTGPNGRLPVLSPHYLRTGQVEELAEPTSKDVVLMGGELILLWDGSNAGEFFRARAGVLSSTMVAFEFDEEETNPDYLYFDLKRFEPELKGRTAGSGIPHVDKEVLLARQVFEGGPDEQKAAAKVLLNVERAIEQTEALLAKQQRIKTGLMHDLLTRGLDAQGRLRDPSTHRFKDSQLGLIPEEWDAVNVEELCDDIVDCPHSTPKYESGGIPCIRTADMVPGKLLLRNAFRVSHSTYLERIARLMPRRGDIIYSREGERLGIASPVEDEPVCLGQRVMLLSPKAETNSTFLTWAMNSPSFYNRVVIGQIATTSPHVNVRDIKKALVVRPEPSEQRLIGEALAADDAERAMLDTCLGKLRRLKSGLMHDLLTGDVPVTPLLSNSAS